MKVGSLFSGYGGLDLAVEKMFNAETVWHCEWEDAPSKTLKTPDRIEVPLRSGYSQRREQTEQESTNEQF
jgi:site-specific DNA-cytosine methylase